LFMTGVRLQSTKPTIRNWEQQIPVSGRKFVQAVELLKAKTPERGFQGLLPDGGAGMGPDRPPDSRSQFMDGETIPKSAAESA
jgi:hypothetical protein